MCHDIACIVGIACILGIAGVSPPAWSIKIL
jgi:hypothetical protein